MMKFLAAIAALLTVAAHLYAMRDPARAVGLILALDHVFAMASAVALLAIATALGRYTTRFRRADDSTIDLLLFDLAIGAGVLSTGMLIVGAVGGFHRPVLALLLAGAALLVRGELRQLPGLLRDAWIELKSKAGIPALCLFGIVGIVMTVLALAPATDWDSLMYHLRIPAQFLERGRIYTPEDNLHVAFVGLVHMLYVPLLAAGAPSACAVVNTIFALALAAAMLTAGTRLFSPSTGRLAMSLLWGSTILILVGITPKIDVTLAFYVFLGHYALLCAHSSGERAIKWFVLAGTLLGLALGAKYLALVYVAALGPLVLVTSLLRTRNVREAIVPLLAFSIVFVLSALPWLIKNWVLLGGPLYPFFARPVLPPWLAALHGTRNVPASIDPTTLQPLLRIREPFSLTRWFLSPERLTPEGEGFGYGANMAFALLPLSLVCSRNRTFAAVFGPGALFVVAIALGESRINLRYLIPSLPALTLAAAATVTAIRARWRLSSSEVALFYAFITGVVLWSSAFTIYRRLSTTNTITHVLGLVSRDDYLRESRNPSILNYASFAAFVNEHVPRNGRLLMLFDARGYRLAPQVLQDEDVITWPLLMALVTPPRCLDSSGITHVLVNRGILDYYVARGLDPKSMLWNRFDDFAARCLILVDRQPGVDLYQLRRR